MTLFAQTFSFDDRDVRLWSHHCPSVLYLDVIPMLISTPRGTIPHVIHFMFPNLPFVPVLYLFTDRQFIIVFITRHDLRFLPTIIVPRHPQTLHLVHLRALRDAHHHSLDHVRRLTCIPLRRGEPSKRFSLSSKGVSIGFISFVFVCHHISLLIYGSLRTPTLNPFGTVTHVSTLVSLIACPIMAITGYVVFEHKSSYSMTSL